MNQRRTTYRYKSMAPSHTHEYLWSHVESFLGRTNPGRVLEVGCGNGSLAGRVRSSGMEYIGIDTSESGIEIARRACPEANFEVASAYDDLLGRFGSFAVVISLEVIEHLFSPREFASRIFDVLEEEGVAMISTPYHGYFKNLVLSLTGRMDAHFTALWDGGHIKFWSISTMGRLLTEAGFVDISFDRVGRVPILAKSMVVTARKPMAAKSETSQIGSPSVGGFSK